MNQMNLWRAAALLMIGLLAPRGQADDVPLLDRFEFSRPEMGVPFRIVLFASNDATATQAAYAAFDRIRQLNSTLSDYDDDSELSRLSRSSGSDTWIELSTDLWTVLQRAQFVAKKSNGAFDVTVGPAVSLWRKARRNRVMPAAESIAETRQRISYTYVHLDSVGRSAKLSLPNMRLDLGGIAKGYAVDEALKVLRSRNIRSALVAASGDIAVSDPPPGQPGWRIAIAPLDVTNAPTSENALLKQAAVSTSGDLSQRVEIGGKRYSHIVDPRTGIGLTDHSLVTVIASDSTTADSLATAVSVLGPVKGLELIEGTPGAAARIVRMPAEKIEIYESKHFKEMLERSTIRQ